MKRTSALSILFLVEGLCLAATSQPAPMATPPGGTGDLRAMAKGGDDFTLALYQKLSQDSDDNIFVSPASVRVALAMAYAGAKGQTQQQMAQVLNLDDGPDVHAAMGQLLQKYQPRPPSRYELTVANALWVKQGVPVRPGFVEIVRQRYGGAVESADFTQASQAAGQINAWAAQATRDKIQNLISPTMLSDQTRLVLTNAVYFKGTWMSRFDPAQTRAEPFRLIANQTVPTSMMQQTGTYAYAQDGVLQVLSMPYQGKDLSMVILLPALRGQPTGNELKELERRLSPDQIDAWVRSLSSEHVQVVVPKFTLSTQYQLVPMLSAMGMPRAFDAQQADFSGMADDPQRLFISHVVHKAYVDVNEEGTEASAATGVIVGVKSAVPTQPRVFRADHPFIFIIRHEPTGTVLFMGRVMNPRGAMSKSQ